MKADFSRKILEYLIVAGMVSIAATSPFFLTRIAKIILKELKYNFKSDYEKFRSAFYYLKKRELIEIKEDGFDIKIAPTKKGKIVMKKYQVMNLKIKRPKKWDGKIRVVAFDIPNTQRIIRNTFRGKLKELGFYSSQKSVWLHPFNCKNEVEILKDFLGLNNKQIYFFTAEKIEDEELLKKIKKAYKI